MLITLSNINWF